MNVAIYHRVSTVDQNPTLARDELHAAAARLGGEVVLSIEEKGSGARNDRPGLQRLLDAARRGKVDAVLCWKLDRFGRSVLDVLANVRALDAAGVRFVVTTQGLDVRPGGDAMSRLILSVLASVAEFERDLIRERTRLGLRKARADGKRIGRPAVLAAAHRGAGEAPARRRAVVGAGGERRGLHHEHCAPRGCAVATSPSEHQVRRSLREDQGGGVRARSGSGGGGAGVLCTARSVGGPSRSVLCGRRGVH